MSLMPRLILFASLSLFLSGCGEEMSADDSIREAKALVEQSRNQVKMIQEREVRRATALLKVALRKDVDHAALNSTLGSMYFDIGAWDDADPKLTKALESGADAADIVPLLAQVLLSTEQFDRLDKLSLDGLRPQGRSIVEAAKALSMIYRGKPALAAEIIAGARDNGSASAFLEVAAARVAMEFDSYDEVQIELKDILGRYPKYAPAWKLLGDIESVRGQPKAALKAYKNANKFSDGSLASALDEIWMQLYNGRHSGALRELNIATEKYNVTNSDHGALFARAMINLELGRLYLARKLFLRLLDESDQYPLSLYYLAVIDLEMGLQGLEQDFSELALSRVYQFLGVVPDSIAGAILAAKIELARSNFRIAAKLLYPLLKKKPDSLEILSLLARTQFGQGEVEKGIETLTTLVALAPAQTANKVRLAVAYLQSGSQDIGIAMLQDILTDRPGYEQADVLLVLNALSRDRVTAAIEHATAYVERSPSSAIAYGLLGRAYAENGNQTRARSAFRRAFELRPGDPLAGIGLAEFELREKRYESARDIYSQVLSRYPKQTQAWKKLAATYGEQARDDDMLHSVREALLADPRSLEARLVQVRYDLAMGRLDSAADLIEGLTQEQRTDPDAMAVIAAWELAVGRYDQALVTLRMLIRLRPEISQYHYMRAKAYAGLGDQKRLKSELTRAAELDPEHFFTQIASARLRLMSGDMDAFSAELSDLNRQAKNNSDVMKLEIFAKQRQGDKVAVSQLLDRLFLQQVSAENLIARASHRQQSGDGEGAVSELRSWLKSQPDDTAVREKLAEIYGRNGQHEAAVKQYKKILEKSPKHASALNNIAWFLLDSDPAGALEYAEKANYLSQGSSAILDTLAMAQLKNGNVLAARRSINRARKIAPENPVFRVHDALILAAGGDESEARVALQEILALKEKFSGRADAEILLEKLQ